MEVELSVPLRAVRLCEVDKRWLMYRLPGASSRLLYEQHHRAEAAAYLTITFFVTAASYAIDVSK